MGVLLSRIVGHDDRIHKLKNYFSQHHAGRTFLFSGPSGVGKKQVAWGLSQILLCENKTPNFDACGVCGSCRRVEKKEHESLMWVDPDSDLIKIDDAKEILQFLRLRSLSKFRIVIIDQAHRMNASAGNSLLKIMEEPPEDLFFFLISSAPTQILQTLRSRSMKVAFQSLSVTDLRKISQASISVLNSVRGRLDLIGQKEDPEQQKEKKSWADELIYLMMNEEAWTDPDWRVSMKEKSSWPLRLQFWMSLLRDCRILKSQTFIEKAQAISILLHPELKSEVQILSQWPTEKIDSIFQKLLNYEKDLVIHRDSVLMMEELMASEQIHKSI